MRIGVFTGSSVARDGGGDTLQSSIAEALRFASDRHEFIVFGQGDTKNKKSLNPASLRERIGAHPVLGPLARRALCVLRSSSEELSLEERFIRDNDIDIAWFLRPAADPVTVPYIATVWDLEHRKQPYFPEVSVTGWTWESRERNYRGLLPRASRILTGTETGKREVVAFYGVCPENVRVVSYPAASDCRAGNVLDAAGVAVKYGIPKPFIFYPAQFWPHKNHVNLLLALQLLNANTREPIHLVLTGSDKGNLGHVQETIHRLGLASQVHFLGFLPREDLIGLYSQAEALVYPTLFGPDNLPPLEAFASGCPVAASNISGADEQMGAAALLFDPTDPSKIAEAIRSIRDNREFRAELIRRGREKVALCTPQQYVKQICSILDELEPFRRCWGRGYVHP